MIKRKIFPCPCHERILGSGGIAPLVPDVGDRWIRVVNFMSRSLYPRERTPVPVLQEVLGSQGRPWRTEEEKNLFSFTGIRTPIRPARTIVTILTELPWLPCEGDWLIIIFGLVWYEATTLEFEVFFWKCVEGLKITTKNKVRITGHLVWTLAFPNTKQTSELLNPIFGDMLCCF